MLPKIDRSNSYTFSIILGSSCNWSCPYCIQSPYNTFSKEIDVNAFCDNFIKYLKKTGYINSIHRIILWGGEPFLYYSTMKTLIERLAPIKSEAPLRVVTNGSLITKDNYQLFNKYKVHVNLSYHDGQLTDDRWEQALKIDNLVVTSMIHHKRLNWIEFYNKWNYIYSTFGRGVKWYVFPIIGTETVPKEYLLTKKDVDTYFDTLYSYLKYRTNDAFFNTALHGLIFEFSNRGLEYKEKNSCFNSKTIAIDLKGNRYLCHHDCAPDTIVGNIFNTSKIIPIFPDYIDSTQNHSCTSCRAYKYCLGGCFRLQDKSISCYYNIKMVDFLNTLKKEYSEYFQDNYLDLIHEV